jgi:hypothetical protein
MSSCGKRNRRNRRSHGGAKEAFGANIQEAFQAKPEAFQAKPEAFQAKPEAFQAKPEAFQAKPEAFQAKPEAFQAKPEAFQAKPEAFQAKPEAPQKGGRRKGGKTRKLSKGARAWTQAVTKIYRQMKAKDKTVKLRDAMKRASALKKRGQL